jgi:hypothetical protein
LVRWNMRRPLYEGCPDRPDMVRRAGSPGPARLGWVLEREVYFGSRPWIYALRK